MRADPILTPSDLVGCQFARVQRACLPEVPPTPAGAARARRRYTGRDRALALLPLAPALGDARTFSRVDIPQEASDFSRELDTLEAIAAGATLITGARLADNATAVDIDILVRDQAAGGYRPITISEHRAARPATQHETTAVATARLGLGGDVLAPVKLRHHAVDSYFLAAAAGLLAAIGQDSGVGGVIGQDRDWVYFEPTAALRQLFEAARGKPLPTRPRRVKECAACRYWPHCREELIALDDISLLLPGDRAARFRERGIDTVAALIEANAGEPSRLARAFRDGRALITRDHPRWPTRPPADVEVDIDVEAYLDQGAYLWGAFDGDAYHGFVTFGELGGQAEAENFRAFWTWLTTLRAQAAAQGQTFRAYCYAAGGENHWLRESAARFGSADMRREVEEFIASEQWVDVFADVAAAFLGPGGLGLKVVARQAGFSWRTEGFDGEASVAAYRVAVGVDPGDRARARATLLAYNEDDCRATARVRGWLASQSERHGSKARRDRREDRQ